MDATRRSYDLVSRRYAEEVAGELAGKPLDRGLLDAFAAQCPPGPVLDVGAGPGHVSAHLAGSRPGPVALDLSPGMCTLAAHRTGLPACAADATGLPVRSGTASGVVCLYTVIHLDDDARAAAYREFRRVLCPGGYVLVSFHSGTGGATRLSEWWGYPVDLTFRYLDPDAEVAAVTRAGLHLTARLDREPYPGVEHPSRRTYLLARAG